MLTVHQLEITIEARTPLALDTYCGSALRGAFFHAFWKRFCSNREASTCTECPLHEACPVASLVAPLRDENPLFRDVPRPYIITSSLTEKKRYEPGETYTFGFTLIGNAARFYPYVVRSFLEMEHHTIGHPLQELQGKRGQFLMRTIHVVHPFTDQRICLWQRGDGQPAKLQLGITADDVATRAKQIASDTLTLNFLSPTRLTDQKKILHQPHFTILALRMAQR